MGDVNDYSTLKIIDFGLVLNYNEEKENQKMIGTTYYMAPKAIKGIFFPENDLWSIGVIMFIMVTSKHAFKGKSKKDIVYKISNCLYDYNTKESDCLKDLIEHIFIINPRKRITVENI